MLAKTSAPLGNAREMTAEAVHAIILLASARKTRQGAPILTGETAEAVMVLRRAGFDLRGLYGNKEPAKPQKRFSFRLPFFRVECIMCTPLGFWLSRRSDWGRDGMLGPLFVRVRYAR